MSAKWILIAVTMSLFLFQVPSYAEDIFMWPDFIDETQARACQKETRSLEELQKNHLIKNGMQNHLMMTR